MDDDLISSIKLAIVCLCFIIIIGIVIWGFVVVFNQVVAEGVVKGFNIEAGYSTKYLVLLDDGKWYVIKKTAYEMIQLEDYIQILRGGVVKII